MKLFVDCEFTDFICCELISIALVSETGDEFYGERSDFDLSVCSEFVREAVLPQLGKPTVPVYTACELREALLNWWREIPGAIGECLVCVDNVIDWDLLIDLLGEVPSGWRGVLVGHLVNPSHQEAYFAAYGGRHHALHDARALRASLVGELSNVVAVADVKPSRFNF
ncbi:3'-5' exoribonuclease [Cupriavidus sp. WKF15]|uniref:3'-5' exoribonuclease n=1 Tax=Cupriavidus sp. WKF15 TaxID=3032282 RepID=UPI0023E23358|nr:3'-5' exoribonuclease [Cupriavidus sp. WKF15]WER45596.1 3'-5' exoribonuclease [Cupriavidus sp. WKF15]